MDSLHQDVFKLHAEIIELKNKPSIPYGRLGHDLTGRKRERATSEEQIYSYRAIVDMGLLDINVNHIRPQNKALSIAGASSDMPVIDLGVNEDRYRVGDKISVDLDYMGILGAMNSKYIEKKIISEPTGLPLKSLALSGISLS